MGEDTKEVAPIGVELKEEVKEEPKEEEIVEDAGSVQEYKLSTSAGVEYVVLFKKDGIETDTYLVFCEKDKKGVELVIKKMYKKEYTVAKIVKGVSLDFKLLGGNK